MTLVRGLLILVAVSLVAVAVHLHIVSTHAENWSSTTGVIVASYVRKSGAGNAGEAGDTDTYSPIVRYEYRVGSEAYAGSRIGFGDFFYNWYSARSRVQAFRKGNVTVYFDPRDPTNAALDR